MLLFFIHKTNRCILVHGGARAKSAGVSPLPCGSKTVKYGRVGTAALLFLFIPMVPLLILSLEDALIVTGGSGDTMSNDWWFKNGIVDKIKEFCRNGYGYCIVSNQDGIGNKMVSEDQFRLKLMDVIRKLHNEIASNPSMAKAPWHSLYCTTANRGDVRRLPNPGMLYEAAVLLNGNLSKSIVVGSEDLLQASKIVKAKFFTYKQFLNEKPSRKSDRVSRNLQGGYSGKTSSKARRR